MIKPGIPINEPDRLRKLRELGIFDTLNERIYEDLTKLAAGICNTPIAQVCLIDEDKNWCKSNNGKDVEEISRDVSFCSHAILDDDLFIVEDASQDERFCDNPLVTSAPFIHFYAGAPLIIDNNVRLGTLCVFDHKPNNLSNEQKESLIALARQVVSQFELKLKIKSLTTLDHVKDEFITMISHELRTPLTSIIGSLGMLSNIEDLGTNKQTGTLIDISYRNSQRLKNIVYDILDASQVSSGKLNIKNENIDLIQLINESINQNLDASHINRCTINFVGNTFDLPVISVGDRLRITQVINNLLSNAIKFSYDEKEIEVSLSIVDNDAKITIINYGPGIAIEDQQYVFDKFRQLGTNNNQKQPGTGLGLNICKKIIDLHKGKIGFESEPGEYTRFYFQLPLAEKIYMRV